MQTIYKVAATFKMAFQVQIPKTRKFTVLVLITK